ncbi:MAG TPA: tRNA (adenosine(37)-N6)-threonylcarbamoyltransferase complex dimerization subunit type 1 TsaB [Paludibacteraceae bacterium]|nr:tRNA (adenosine(37)-N6)-threonylcarbamoyltransferase complex dimerization subunit type 1 TsaB [Paludibacteraceae bacterium]HRS67915.1 tRNA (adenosine(37)-N6)-threonylcarbamoyltransferase complex dimerization subunit type 1 TsaB [Paludibacteraceae bacterium]
MATILHIETATDVCSTALSEHGELLFSKISFEGPAHATNLPLFIEETLDFARKHNKLPNAIAVSSGPGSYTGLRIGVSTAKGLCYGLEAKLIAVNTLRLITQNALLHIKEANALICPLIDARRMEVYTAIYDENLNEIQPVEAKIIDESAFIDLLDQRIVYFCGNGAEKCKTLITHSNARFLADIHPLANHMIHLAEEAYQACLFEDVAYFEPFYLKEFQATVSKKSIINS